jgi:hypothetical protein
MQVGVAMALAAMLLAGGCSMLGGEKKSPPSDDSDTPSIVRRAGPGFVTRCPVPKAYDNETTRKIEQAIESLPSDSVLRPVMKDYEVERDDLRMCQ